MRVFALDFLQPSPFPRFGDTAPCCLYPLKIPPSVYLKVLQILCEIYFLSLLVVQNEIGAKISKISRIASKGVFFRVTNCSTLSNPYFGHLQHQSNPELRIPRGKESKTDACSSESLVRDRSNWGENLLIWAELIFLLLRFYLHSLTLLAIVF